MRRAPAVRRAQVLEPVVPEAVVAVVPVLVAAEREQAAVAPGAAEQLL